MSGTIFCLGRGEEQRQQSSIEMGGFMACAYFRPLDGWAEGFILKICLRALCLEPVASAGALAQEPPKVAATGFTASAAKITRSMLILELFDPSVIFL